MRLSLPSLQISTLQINLQPHHLLPNLCLLLPILISLLLIIARLTIVSLSPQLLFAEERELHTVIIFDLLSWLGRMFDVINYSMGMFVGGSLKQRNGVFELVESVSFWRRFGFSQIDLSLRMRKIFCVAMGRLSEVGKSVRRHESFGNLFGRFLRLLWVG